MANENNAASPESPASETQAVTAPADDSPAADAVREEQPIAQPDSPKSPDEPMLAKSDESRLADLLAERDAFARRRALRLSPDDPSFTPFADCDVILDEGTVVRIGGVEVTLLRPTPVMAAAFRDEEVFVEHLAQEHPRNIAANASAFRGRYNGNGRRIGRNDEHSLNRLDDAIEDLQRRVDARRAETAAAETEAAGQKEE